MEILSDDDILNICERLNMSDLETFMKTSKRNNEICFNIWNKRHKLKFGARHKFVEKEERDKFKKCLRQSLIGREYVLSELYEIVRYHPELFRPELLRLLIEKLDEMIDEISSKIEPIYGEDIAEETNTEWNENEYEKQLDKVRRKYLHQILDNIHSDRSLINLRDNINRYFVSENYPEICLDYF